MSDTKNDLPAGKRASDKHLWFLEAHLHTKR
jgi:hypothetical protein